MQIFGDPIDLNSGYKTKSQHGVLMVVIKIHKCLNFVAGRISTSIILLLYDLDFKAPQKFSFFSCGFPELLRFGILTKM